MLSPACAWGQCHTSRAGAVGTPMLRLPARRGCVVCRGSGKPRIAITVGDPAGIGTETVLKALSDPAVSSAADISVVCTPELVHTTHRLLVNRPSRAQGHKSAAASMADPGTLQLHSVPLEPEVQGAILPGMGTAASGEASFRYLSRAITQALEGEVDAVVTGPISKSSWHLAQHCYPGQTELLAERSGVSEYGMLFVATSPTSGWQLRCLLATSHIPLSQVSQVLDAGLLDRKLRLLIASLQHDFGLDEKQLHIAVAGLNPHAGEGGQLGVEEVEWLLPWLQQQQAAHPLRWLEGPVPPDTLWVRPGQAWFGEAGAWKGLGVADAYIAMYHDQGLIPVKLMAFDHAVNTTIGLPFVRTSPDHGTAFGIAELGIADARSMKAAILTAADMVQQRKKGAAASAAATKQPVGSSAHRASS